MVIYLFVYLTHLLWTYLRRRWVLSVLLTWRVCFLFPRLALVLLRPLLRDSLELAALRVEDDVGAVLSVGWPLHRARALAQVIDEFLGWFLRLYSFVLSNLFWTQLAEKSSLLRFFVSLICGVLVLLF